MGMIYTLRPSRDGFITQQNYVYAMVAPYIEQTAFVKVGVSLDPLQRLASIASGCPLRIAHLRAYRVGPRHKAFRVEADVHARLSGFRERGEWFRFDMADKDHKQALWGAFRSALAPYFRTPPEVLDVEEDQIQEAVNLAVMERWHGRRKMLRPA
jgi:hypothetical protein